MKFDSNIIVAIINGIFAILVAQISRSNGKTAPTGRPPKYPKRKR